MGAPSNEYAVPAGLVVDNGETLVDWRAADGRRFKEPFFEDTLIRYRRWGHATHRTPLSALEDTEADPAMLIFHVSRCGSTLAGRMLGAPPAHLAVSEAPILDDLLRGTPEATDEQRIVWLRGAMAAFLRSQATPAERLFVKLDAWHLFQLPLLGRAFPSARRLFLYREPIEVLASLARMPSTLLIRDTVPPALLGLTEDERDHLSRDELAAAIQGALYRTALTHRDRLTAIDYRDLPNALEGALSDLPLTDEDKTLMRAATAADAKSPGLDFTPDAERKRAEASPALFAAAERWTTPDYRRWREALTA